MDAVPPSYEKATLVTPWDLVAPHLTLDQLLSAGSVNKRWHAIFMPFLWGDPASYFGVEHDEVHTALTKFRRTLRIARPSVRALTHTLRIPAVDVEIFGGPDETWLRDFLERLPYLQSLIVSGSSFLDHSSLQALNRQELGPGKDGLLSGLVQSSDVMQQCLVDTVPDFGLRLLDASYCLNATSSQLSQALERFKNLFYLDLSFTMPARDTVVLDALRSCAELQVIRLRGINMNDHSAETLAHAIGRRVRSLDLRHNQIGDSGVQSLVASCFASSPASELPSTVGHKTLELYQSERFEDFLRQRLTRDFAARQVFEGGPEGGITHLYMAGNRLTAAGANVLLRLGRLHVLDLQSVAESPQPTFGRQEEWDGRLTLSGVECLTTVIASHASEAMRFLRIDHHLVTTDLGRSTARSDGASSESAEKLSRGVVGGDGALASAQVFGSSADPRAPTRPVPNSLPPSQPPLASDCTSAVDGQASARPRALGSASGHLEAVFGATRRLAMRHIRPSSEGGATVFPSSAPMVPTVSCSTCASAIGERRKARITAHTAISSNLHPAMTPHVRVLVLTAVPPVSSTPDVAYRLINFIKMCAEEARLAKREAQLDYALPPGQKGRNTALEHAARMIFALEKLVLEMAPACKPTNTKTTSWQNPNNKSLTDDPDSDSMWAAAAGDFSFFNENKTDLEPMFSRFAGSQSKALNGEDRPLSIQTRAPAVKQFDTISLVSDFRNARRMARQRACERDGVNSVVEGYWDGIVQVIRL